MNIIFRNIYILFLIVLFFTSANVAIAEKWGVEKIDEKLRKTEPDIKIFSRKRGEYKEYRGEVVLEASIESVYGLVRDTENFEWIKNTKKFDVKELNFLKAVYVMSLEALDLEEKYYMLQGRKKACVVLQLLFILVKVVKTNVIKVSNRSLITAVR